MPWFDCYVLHVKLMLITGRIGRYIQISWDPFVHLETSCAGKILVIRGVSSYLDKEISDALLQKLPLRSPLIPLNLRPEK